MCGIQKRLKPLKLATAWGARVARDHTSRSVEVEVWFPFVLRGSCCSRLHGGLALACQLGSGSWRLLVLLLSHQEV